MERRAQWSTVPAPVLLVRHGESEWNVARRTQGQTRHPRLTAAGREQAAAAADRVGQVLGHRVLTSVRITSSDLTRALETAEVVGRRLGVPVLEDPRLREMALGSLEGLSYEETWRAAEEHDWSDLHLPVGGGESPAQVRSRMAAVLSEARADAARGIPVVLVTHGDAIRHAADVLRDPQKTGDWLEVPNGAVFLVEHGVTRVE
ncbi:histidine phosphatase family protein [Nocardioides daphniae]|uniref:histidine phosphatase family protein n=1 Tax=Nocardioides daphniae TaxID=402297 RepID=UPI0013153CE8